MAIATEKTPVSKRPAPTVRILPIDPNLPTASEPANTPSDRTTSSSEYV